MGDFEILLLSCPAIFLCLNYASYFFRVFESSFIFIITLKLTTSRKIRGHIHKRCNLFRSINKKLIKMILQGMINLGATQIIPKPIPSRNFPLPTPFISFIQRMNKAIVTPNIMTHMIHSNSAIISILKRQTSLGQAYLA